MDGPPPFGGLICAYDLDCNRVLLPEYVRQMSWRKRRGWLREHNLVPAVGGGSMYSWFEMMQPYMVTDGPAVTAAAETILTQAAYFTLPANFFSFTGKTIWFRAMGKVTNVITTPGTYTLKVKYGTGVVGDTQLVTSGAITPESVAARTDQLWYLDCFIKALAVGQLTTSLTLVAYGRVYWANQKAFASAAEQNSTYMPPGLTSVANVTGLDGTAAKTITLTVTPTVATGSITCREAWISALN